MSNPLLPATTRKSFYQLNVKDTIGDSLKEFCEEALLIPHGTVTVYDRVPDMDSYYVYVTTGYRFVVSGQELHQWESNKSHPYCTPGRDTRIHDQG